MAENFEGKVAIITGASSGIGLETARLFSSLGIKTVLAARSREKLEALEKELKGSYSVPTDVTDAAAVQNLVTKAFERFGRIDLLINNAGVLIYKPMADCSMEEVRRLMEVNYFAQVACVNAVLPYLRKQKSGHIVNVASVGGRVGFPNLGFYCASKFAFVGYTETLRQEIMRAGIRVSLVCPGTVETPMTQELLDEARRKKKSISPIRPEAVAQAILDAIQNNRAEVFLPGSTRFLNNLHFVFPKFAEWLAWKFRSSDPETFN